MRQLTTSLCLILLVFLGVVGKSFALPTCESDAEVWNNCFGSWTFENGSKYDGSKYVGEWRNNKKHGQGTFTTADGDKYVGEFIDGRLHGKGTATFADGRVEEGIWENDNFLSLYEYAKKNAPPVPEKKPTVTENPDKLVTAASGSGFAVSSSGHVITNNHVIEGCDTVKIHHQGKTSKAIIITYDPNDLALLKGNFTPSTVLPKPMNIRSSVRSTRSTVPCPQQFSSASRSQVEALTPISFNRYFSTFSVGVFGRSSTIST